MVVLINEDGKVLKKLICCPKCKKKVSFIDSLTVHCKRCGTIDLKDLIKTLGVIYSSGLSFTEIN